MDFIHSERSNLEKSEINKNSKKKKIITWILISVIGALIIATAITVTMILINKNKNKEGGNEDIETDNETNEIKEKIPENEIELEKKKLQKEFNIVSNVGDLKRVSVVQKSVEETKINNNLIKTEIKRKTNYDIYIASEEDPDEDNKLFYSKMYTCAISIVSECITTDGTDCEPQRFVDLTGEAKSKSNNIRVLNSVEDFKDIPLALCYYNITDNNFITSMTCPESFPDSKKNEMILDLYFFRPPNIQRADKSNDNITITINEDKENNKTYIRETNGGLCNIFDNFGSMCTTDMNTTTDLEGHLLAYDELAITNITTDENNSYLKTKLTNLIDISEKIDNLDPVKYKNKLDKIMPKLEPYMKVDVHFTHDNFTDLYNLVQEKSKSDKKHYLPKKQKKTFRSLMDYTASFTKQQSLFDYKDVGGIQVNLYMKDDSGINTQAMRVYSDLHFDDKENLLTNLEEYTDLQKILDELIELSKAGNHLATELYEKITNKLEGITNEISLNIKKLNKLLKYYDLSDVFDSTMLIDSISKLPLTIIAESKTLIDKLTAIYNGIKSGNMRNHAEKLGDNIYNYIKQSHILIKKIFDNLKELGNTLNSKNNKITEVTTYYLNHTSSSYINTIKEAENILENYFKNEYNLLYPMVEELLKEFEDTSIDVLQKEKKIINNLYKKLESKNFTIDYANDEDYKNIILNLYNSDKYITDIINKIKEYFKEEIGIKDSGYFISNNDININKQTFTPVINESKEVALKLDKDEYIDKKFDEFMIIFKENYTNIMEFMETKKSEQFPLNENTLKTTLFTSNDKNKIETDMTNFRVQISNKIKRENDYYIDKIKNYLSNFLNDNLNELNTYISDLDILFSEESLEDLKNSFNTAFNSCLKTITDDIKKNEVTAKNYFDNLYQTINNNNFFINQLKSYKTNEIPNYYIRRIFYKRFMYFVDSITSKEKTNGYIKKYNEFIANFDYYKTYLSNQLYLDVLNEYKLALTQIRKILQTIKNLKITDKYPDFPEFEFYNTHIRTVDKLYDRLTKFFSDDLFNKNYISPINNNKNENNKYIDSLKTYINNKHTSINKLPLYNDNSNDFCVTYKRKLCYGCTNCAWYTFVYNRLCLPLPTYSNNYLNLIKSSIKTDVNLIQFKNKFNNFYSSIKNKINDYNNKFKNLENKFLEIKLDALNQNFTQNYLTSLKDSFNSILNQKYGNNIIEASYVYYQELINDRLKNILDNVTSKWEDTYNYILNELDSNYDDFKNSIYEFSLMGEIYKSLISTNITTNYFNSIVLFQRTEFNYTISFYYNYYLKVINEAYQYILSKIPKNENGFNDIINTRKNEINTLFNNLLKEITNSKNEALSIKKQIDVLKVSETNFFNVNSILTDNIHKTNQILEEKMEEFYEYIGEEGDDISLISRFYLENKENGKQIEKFYDPVNHEIFVYLNLEKFKDIMIENWIFDQDDFINKLNLTLYETSKEIKDELATKKESYSDEIENEINKYFIDDSIENKINKLYLAEVKDLTTTQINTINTNINQILSKIKEIITKEAERLKTTSTSYNTNYNIIENTLNYYKTYIFREINTTIFSVLEGFYKNIYNNVYTNCMESRLNEYNEEGKKSASHKDYGIYTLYNSTYNIGEIVKNLLNTIVQNYKEITSKKIKFKYNEYYTKIKNSVNIIQIQNLINNEIDNAYKSVLLPKLKTFAIYNPGDEQYKDYDLNDDYKKEINTTITAKNTNINSQILSTKGSNYKAHLSTCDILDFSLSGINVITPICKNFKNTLSSQKEEQKKKINNLIQGIIKNNFNDLLNNIIPTFGNLFFDRIIKYNENFKIKSLYDNLKCTLSQTLLYYIALNIYKDVDTLPRDLKIRLYNLNNLDLTVEKKNKQILSLLEKKTNEFIKDSKIQIMEKYMSYLQSDVSIKQAFSNIILDKIDDNLIEMKPEMEKKYQNMLLIYLKEKLINSYSKVMNDKTKEMIMLVNERKEVLKSKLDDLFSLDSDQVLFEVNEKINNTLDAINEYNNYFGTIKISQDTYDFLNSYGNSTIKPIFETFKIELNKATKDKLTENVDENSKQIESLSPNDFISQSNNITQYFNSNYINNITLSIESYGIDNYKDNLDIERNKKRSRILRLLDGTETEEDIAESARERIVDREVEEIFDRILSTSNNIKNYFDSLKEFSDFDKKLTNYKNNLNIAYKSSKDLIEKNEYEVEIDTYLNQKLNNLSNISNYYYDKINESYYQLRDFLNKSLQEIDNSLNQCADNTYKIFNKEYENITNKANTVDTKYTDNRNDINKITYKKSTEHKTNKVDASLSDYREYGEFKFGILYEQTKIKKPKIYGCIINKSRPKKVSLQIKSPFGNCGEIVNEIEIEFNDANYTMNLISDSNNINITTITNFEKYIYSTEVFQYGETNETEKAEVDGNEVEYKVKCKKKKEKVLTNKFDTEVDEVNESETNIIQG